ncbi:MAG TPA: pitrilysin family protein [Candidatus Koribacter sp.]|jgi:zinc protease
MKTRSVVALLALVLVGCSTIYAQEPAKKTTQPTKSSQKPAWEKIPTPPLPPFKPVEPRRVELSNGMVIFLQEDHELPLIAATMRIRGGNRDEAAAKAGMLDIYGEVWRTGGTKTKTGDQLDDVLEARAAKIETDNNQDSTGISLSCLKQDFASVFDTFLDVLRNPEFREEKIELAKDQEKSGISRRNDQIGGIAGREAVMLAYGKDNPYARTPEYATVDAVTRQDLIAWHDQHVHPNNMIFGMVGDFDSAAMEAKLRAAFESWAKGPELPAFHAEFKPAAPGLYFVNKSDVNQSEIRMVGLGIERNNPDYYAIEVMNEVFGGGFSSRLFSNIRTKQGLAYAVYGGVGSAFDHPGMFRIGMGTKSVTTVEAIQSLDSQIDDLVKTPPSAEELARAKAAILNSFIFNLDTPEKVLREKMAYEFYHYPLDFLELYRINIEKVTSQDVARVAEKYVHKDQLAVLVVGNEAEMGTQKLSSLGKVTPIDITIPTGGGAQEAEAAPTASTPEGKALAAKFVEAIGGKQKVDAVKALEQQSTSTRSTPQGEMTLEVESVEEYPDHIYQQLSTPMGKMNMAVTPQVAYMAIGGQVGDMPATSRDEALKSMKRDVIAMAQHVDDPKYVFAAAGTSKVGDVEANVLKIDADGVPTTWYLDPKTNLPIRSEFSAVAQAGPVTRTIDFKDWKPVEGITLYMARTVSDNGKPSLKETIKQWTINPKVDPNYWQKPAATAQPEGEQPK